MMDWIYGSALEESFRRGLYMGLKFAAMAAVVSFLIGWALGDRKK